MSLVFVLYALFASVFVVAKDALHYASPVFLIGSRMTLSGIVLLGYAYYKNPSSIRISKKLFLQIGLLGLCNIYLTNILELWGLSYLSSFKTCFLYSLSPFLSALFSYALSQETFSPKKWMGLLIGFAGFLPTLFFSGSKEEISGLFYGCSLAELSVLGAVICSVLGWIFLHKTVTTYNCSIATANGYSMLFGGLLALTQSAATEDWNPLPVSDISTFFQYTIFLTIVSNCLAYNLYGYLLKRFSPTFMSLSGLSTPIFTGFLGKIFYNEPIAWHLFVSLAIVGIGLHLFYADTLRKKTALTV